MKKLSENPAVVILGIIASCISVFAFFTDINSIKDFFTPNEVVLSAGEATQKSGNGIPVQPPTAVLSQGWSGILKVRMPTLNEIRADDPISLWVENHVTVSDMHTPGIDQYSGEAIHDHEYLFPVYWCANTADLLQQNMDNIETVFTVNGETVPEKYIFNYNYDTSNGWKCSYHAVVFSGWNLNTHYDLQAKRTLKIDLSDGESSYKAGEYIFALSVSVK